MKDQDLKFFRSDQKWSFSLPNSETLLKNDFTLGLSKVINKRSQKNVWKSDKSWEPEKTWKFEIFLKFENIWFEI